MFVYSRSIVGSRNLTSGMCNSTLNSAPFTWLLKIDLTNGSWFNLYVNMIVECLICFYYTFFENVWFQTHGSEVHVFVAMPSLIHASTLNKMAATCEHTSPHL